MKTILKMIMAIAAMFTIAGCNELPTVEKITKVSKAVGKTAGYVCQLSKVKTEVKDAIVKAIDAVSTVVPTNGQTFAEAWTPLAESELKKLVDAGKLDESGAQIANQAISIVCDGIDYVFVKYPKAKDAKELVSAATSGFVTGFKSVVSFANGVDANIDIDEEAYKYLRLRIAK